MNAVSKVNTSKVTWSLSLPHVSVGNLWLMLLVIASIISAFAVIYCRDLSRDMTSNLQNLKSQTQQMQLQQNQLLVEQSALATDQRVAYIAQNQLHMVVPNQKNVIMVRT